MRLDQITGSSSVFSTTGFHSAAVDWLEPPLARSIGLLPVERVCILVQRRRMGRSRSWFFALGAVVAVGEGQSTGVSGAPDMRPAGAGVSLSSTVGLLKQKSFFRWRRFLPLPQGVSRSRSSRSRPRGGEPNFRRVRRLPARSSGSRTNPARHHSHNKSPRTEKSLPAAHSPERGQSTASVP